MTMPQKVHLKNGTRVRLAQGCGHRPTFCTKGQNRTIIDRHCPNPHMLGIGIDEDTGLVISDDSVFEVVGSHAVTVIDGSHSDYSNVSELKPDEILAITNVVMHVLPAGYKYNVRYRKPIT